MKIVCDNCATKYSIADEKVRGKVFKIRCKKCSHIIVVRGNENGAEANGAAAGGHGDAFSEESLSAASASAARVAGASADSVWHLVIDREQVGPMTAAEVRAKFAAGEIDVETYAWREGFGDWLRLGSIDDFRDLEAKAPAAAPSDEGATRRTDAADLFARAAADEAEANQDAGADLFGAAGASPAAAPAPAAKPAAADVFAPSPASSSFGGEAAPARSARASSPKLNPAGSDLDRGGATASAAGEPRMAGQRNENSVLFSLNNLQALASGSGGAKSSGAAAAKPGVDTRPGYANSQSEGSGLIDIRAMAASTLAAAPASSSSSKEEPPTFAAPPIFSPMAAPIMMPAAPTGTPKWVFAVLGVGVLAVVGIIVVGVLLLTRKPELPPVVAVAPTTPTAPTVAPPTAPVPTPGTPAVAPAAPTTATPQPAAEAKANAPKGELAADKKGSSSKRDKKEKAAAAKSEANGSVVPPPSETPKAAPSAPAKKRDAIDDLLDGASPDKGSKKPAASAPAASSGGEDLPDQLDKSAIVAGMSKVKGKVAACYDQYKVPGLANVSVTIAKSGSIQSASVSGAFAGTPTGACVEKAVKTATFSKFKGSPMTLTYPFMLR
jgi:predicted Zn finger-like uncharacterized protein